MHTKLQLENLKGKDNMMYLSVDWMIILKRILEKCLVRT